ncbi:MAG: hypothetical protein LDL11_08245 [Desulfarculus sp.]|nr:hypothetical protein [Desulfarculus sp.]
MSLPPIAAGFASGWIDRAAPVRSGLAGQTTDKTEQKSGPTSGDRVSLSAGGRSLAASLPLLHGVAAGADGSVQLADLKARQREILADLGAALSRDLTGAGVATQPPLRLSLDAQGQVVCPDAARAEAVEKVFQENPALRDQAAEAMALGSLLAAADRHLEFARAYAQDPEAALAQYAGLFGGSSGQDWLLLDGQELIYQPS